MLSTVIEAVARQAEPVFMRPAREYAKAVVADAPFSRRLARKEHASRAGLIHAPDTETRARGFRLRDHRAYLRGQHVSLAPVIVPDSRFGSIQSLLNLPPGAGGFYHLNAEMPLSIRPLSALALGHLTIPLIAKISRQRMFSNGPHIKALMLAIIRPPVAPLTFGFAA